jgi:predicted DNA-binding protein
MPGLTHRLQVLVDDERYERLSRESERTGTPIGAIVRDAIDSALPAGRDRAPVAAAAERLLAAEPMPVDDWAEMKREKLDEHRAARVGRGAETVSVRHQRVR